MKFELIKANIASNKTRSFLTVFSISISMILIIIVANLFSQIKTSIVDNAQYYDVLIGANGSKTQLVLNTFMFYDEPLGNIDYHFYELLQEDERVSQVIPIAMGDNYNGYKIVGTKVEYIENLNTTIKEGILFDESAEVVIGSEIARKTDLRIGDEFTGMHGLGTDKSIVGIHDEAHDDFKYIVVGILEETKSPNDEILFTSIDSVWEVHGHQHENEEEHNEETEECGCNYASITALLVKSKGFQEAFLLTEEFDSKNEIQAINPAATLRSFLETINLGEKIATVMAYISVLLSFVTLFVVMLSAANERKKSISVLRALGANKKTVFSLVLYETIILTFIGCITGIIIAHISLGVLNTTLFREYGIYINEYAFTITELWAVIIAFILGIGSSILPSIKVYKENITKHLY